MPKGQRRALGLGEQWSELERSLAMALRRNHVFAERLVREPLDEKARTELKGFLEKSGAAGKKPAVVEKHPAPRILSEKDRLLDRFVKALRMLSDANLRNLYELAKSMGRVERARQGSQAPAGEVPAPRPEPRAVPRTKRDGSNGTATDPAGGLPDAGTNAAD